ncbi:DUF6588 family protein [Marinoscillum sp. MHG1-6]|uniref:DUF6588 family protein n=1 Tax=Marinoscillum sp. MHG1-6 TaxID=2959627 RepID=UPI002157F097|nr:DUF6588 family protein [Marinoscillum sp. MHG1-6]
MKKLFIAILISAIAGTTANAQLEIDNLLEGGIENANVLVGGYLDPAFAGLGYALNAGWYNTARPHKLLGIDFTFGVNMAMVPNSAKFFKVAETATMTIGNPENPNSPLYGNNKVPTMFGPNLSADDIPYLEFNQGTPEISDDVRITAPTGMGIDEELPFLAVPAPFAQVGIGLIKNTEIKMRLPIKVNTGDASFSMFGLGVMHDVKQWIPGIKNLPFDLSGFFGFNKLAASVVVDEDLGQEANFEVGGTTLQGVISKKLAVLTVYSGLGFTTSKTTFKLKGDYSNVLPAGESSIDPINLTSNNGGAKFNVGARLKLLILTLHAEYSFQQYNTFTAGVGLSIR